MHSTPEAVSPRTNVTRYTGLIEHYRDRLPLAADARAISLGEGRTPLIKLENLPKQIGFEGELYVKFEGLNPTGSFKDRGMRSEEHTSELQSLMRISYAVFCLKKKKHNNKNMTA